MFQDALSNELSVASGRASSPRTWAGTLVKCAERATCCLHLMAFPCEKCKGPVVAGWIGKREDEITQETDIRSLGSICLSCGSRPEALIDPVHARHFRPVQWECLVENKPAVLEPGGDPLSDELSQDADRPEASRLSAKPQR